MKPLKIIMNAFGPYSKKTEINFEDFNLSGLYLVTGDTGAGKTTVFDAITFALFGSASGTTRNKAGDTSLHLRSDFAKEDQISYVELTFLCRGEKYKIYRTTTRKKTDKSKKGFSLVSESVELTKPDGSIISNKKEVTAEIQNLLGIDKDQFSQIVMLAQGEFQTLLTSKTGNREEIFRRIFKTDKYRLFQDKLFGRLKQSEDYKDKLADNLRLYIEQILCDEETDLYQLKTAENKAENAEEIIKLLNEQNEEDKKAVKKFDKTIKKLVSDIDAVSQKIGEATQIKKNKAQLEDCEKRLPKLKDELKKAEAALKEAEKQKPKKTKADKIIANLEKELPKYEELNNSEKQLESAKTDFEACEQELSEKEKSFSKAKKEYEQNNKAAKELASTDAELQKNANNLEKIANKLLSLNDLQQKYDDLLLKQDELIDAKNAAKESEKEYTEAKDDYDTKYLAYNRNIAGILAESLEQGKKCPVCGATKHPSPAKKTDESISEDAVKEAKNLAEDKQKKYDASSKLASNLKTQCSEKEEQILSDGKKLFKKITLKELPDKLKEELKTSKEKEQEYKEKEATLKDDLAKYNSYKTKIAEFESKRETYESAIKQAETDKNNANNKITQIETQIKEVKKSLQYPDYESANKELQANKALSNDIEESINKAKEDKENSAKELADIEGQIKSLKESVKDKKDINLDELDEEFEQLTEQRDAQNDKKELISSRFNRNNDLHDKIKTTNKQYIKTRSEYGDIDLLSKTASGNLSGAQKISFEQYVQTAYFDRVIRAANERFRQISYNQYELVRKEDFNNRVKGALDLNVMDYHTGEERSVNTLSGGESFKAALSLSLGLSDIVQNQSGGIQIDAMFIDEGFGSLDDESLEQALGVLISLSDGDRLIGVISHVKMLKEIIEKQIVVTKTPTGSVLEVKLP